MSDLMAAALRYAARGWPVFPLIAGTKRPATANGFHDGTTEEGQVERWWDHGLARHNIGIRCGGTHGGPDVLDVDNPRAFDLWRTELPEHELPRTSVARTPSGGYHYYFQPTGGPRRIGVPEGCDWLGDGGYAVAPPSIVDGRRYEWTREAPLAECPAWLDPRNLQGAHDVDIEGLPESMAEVAELLADTLGENRGVSRARLGLALLEHGSDDTLRMLGDQLANASYIEAAWRRAVQDFSCITSHRNTALRCAVSDVTRFHGANPRETIHALMAVARKLPSSDPTAGLMDEREIRTTVGSAVFRRFALTIARSKETP